MAKVRGVQLGSHLRLCTAVAAGVSCGVGSAECCMESCDREMDFHVSLARVRDKTATIKRVAVYREDPQHSCRAPSIRPLLPKVMIAAADGGLPTAIQMLAIVSLRCLPKDNTAFSCPSPSPVQRRVKSGAKQYLVHDLAHKTVIGGGKLYRKN
ncbi:hypothetical protein BaRGS_00001761 [Batillaria attramentaria]|uniref:Secreted protein n=1 Tax=Batillaria attramentaria TaxID=370345 RepID=A0ABD0M5V5_9CAEN